MTHPSPFIWRYKAALPYGRCSSRHLYCFDVLRRSKCRIACSDVFTGARTHPPRRSSFVVAHMPAHKLIFRSMGNFFAFCNLSPPKKGRKIIYYLQC